MIDLVLLDLDDTLLATDMDHFLPLYLSALGEKLQPIMPAAEMISLVLDATHKMMIRENQEITNAESFAEHFFPRLNCERVFAEHLIDAFYQTDYPKLRRNVSRVSQARVLVEFLLEMKCGVVIATNPLFPQTAIMQRLEWAGLDNLPLRLVTTMENSYACKPDPRYYQQILESCRIDAAQAVMIGNDLQNDIEPADAAGLLTYHLKAESKNADALNGALAACLDWLKEKIA